MKDTVKIGCGAAFWGDSAAGAAQLVHANQIDYLIMDYLAEITLSILARLKARDADAGYATDFISAVMQPLLRDIAAQGIRVVTNAGGINPIACKKALEKLAHDAGVSLNIAAIDGDDLSNKIEELRALDVREMSTGARLPERIATANAYLGATPIAAALAAGADVVITGRCVDSALALGPLLHEFNWSVDNYDKLAAGSLVGHVIECGTQCTGGLFTDWESVPGWDNMGFPIAECHADGSFEISKPADTGGLISPATVAEQIVYEIGDPTHYLLPDVNCDFSSVTVAQTGTNRVRVTGARGRAPGPQYKASITWPAGYRATAMMMIGGIAAAAKAERVAHAILARTRRFLRDKGWDDFSEVSIEVLGNEATYGPHARCENVREVVLKLAVKHSERRALELFATEIYPTATAMSPGITGFAGGRPPVQPVIRLFSCLVPKSLVNVQIDIEPRPISVVIPILVRAPAPAEVQLETLPEMRVGRSVPVPLLRLAHARSGDKGDSANIGVLARAADFVPLLRAQLSSERVADWFRHAAAGPVVRYEWPGLNGFNFVLENALGGGGVASLRHDPQGKAYAQMLLDLPINVPIEWLADGGILGPACA